MPAAEDEEGSARKRRRLRATPSRPASPPEQAQRALLPPPPSFLAVAAAVARLAADLQERCRQQSGPESAAAFAALLGLLGPLAPRPAVAMAASALTAALEAAGSSGSRRQSMNVPPEQLGALLRLTLAALQAGLVEAAASRWEVDAATALSKLRGFESQLHSVLQRAWHQGSSSSGATAGGGAAEDGQLMSLAAGLAAVQAQLLHPEDQLKLLQQALEGSTSDDGGTGTGGSNSVAAAAAVLLPAAACIAAHTRDSKDSAPRATQGGRRSKQPTPNPVVTALQQLVGSGGQRPPAVLAAAARGLLCAVRHSREALHTETPLLALAAIDAALGSSSSGSSSSAGSGAFGLSQLLHASEAGNGEGPQAEFQPSLSASMSEWMRPALEHLAAAQLPSEGQVRFEVVVPLRAGLTAWCRAWQCGTACPNIALPHACQGYLLPLRSSVGVPLVAAGGSCGRHCRVPAARRPRPAGACPAAGAVAGAGGRQPSGACAGSGAAPRCAVCGAAGMETRS